MMATLATIVTLYAVIGYLTGCFVGVTYYVGFGDHPPNKVAVKCGLFWPWYIAKWVLQTGKPKK